MRVAVVGAGGLGSYVGAVLWRAGHEVALVARGDHAAAIRTDGLRVSTVDGDFVAQPDCVLSALELDGADLTLVTVKAYSLDEVGPQVVHLGRAGSVVVPLLNGVTASERLVALGVPGEHIVDGIAYMTSFRTAPGRIERRADHHSLVVGSSTGADAAAIDLIVEAFDTTGIEIVAAADINVELWRKMAVVCALSVVCAISGRPMGPIRAHRYGAELQRRTIAEIISVGRAQGADLSKRTEDEIGVILDAFPADFHPSVIHDLLAGKRTEMEDLGGAIVRMGAETGVDVPLHYAATLAVQVREGGPTSG